MRVGAAVTGALGKRKILIIVFIVYSLGGKPLNGLGKQMRVIRAFYLLGDFGLRPLGGMNHQGTSLDQRPFYRLFGAVNLKTLAEIGRASCRDRVELCGWVV